MAQSDTCQGVLLIAGTPVPYLNCEHMGPRLVEGGRHLTCSPMDPHTFSEQPLQHSFQVSRNRSVGQPVDHNSNQKPPSPARSCLAPQRITMNYYTIPGKRLETASKHPLSIIQHLPCSLAPKCLAPHIGHQHQTSVAHRSPTSRGRLCFQTPRRHDQLSDARPSQILHGLTPAVACRKPSRSRGMDGSTLRGEKDRREGTTRRTRGLLSCCSELLEQVGADKPKTPASPIQNSLRVFLNRHVKQSGDFGH